jgi:hypothetical protein
MLVVMAASLGGAHRPGRAQRRRLAEAKRASIEASGLPGAVARQACPDEGRRNGVLA